MALIGMPPTPQVLDGGTSTPAWVGWFQRLGALVTAPITQVGALSITGELTVAGPVAVQSLGQGITIKEGVNAKQGIATLVAGTVTIPNTSITSVSRVFLTSQLDGGAPGFLRISSRTAGVSFVVTSGSATDTSTVAYLIMEPT